MANVSRLQTGNNNLPAETLPPLPTPPGGGGGDEGGSGLSARQILGTLRRHKLLIGGLALIGTTIAWLVANQMAPVYQAQAEMVVEPQSRDVMRSPADYAQQPIDYRAMETEAAKLRAERLARQSVIALGLAKSPLYNPDLAPPEQSRLRAIFQPALQILHLADPPAKPQFSPDEIDRRLAAMSPEARDRLTSQIADAWLVSLSTQAMQTSLVLTVRFRSPDPQLAAASVNQAIRSYIEDQKKEKSEGPLEMMKFLSTRIDDARAKVVEAERNLAKFRAENAMYDTTDASSLAKTLADIRTQLLAADQVATQKELGIKQGVSSDLAGTTLLTEVAAAEKELQAVASYAAPGHPEYMKAAKRLAAVRARLDAERQRGAINLQAEAKAARENANKLRAEADRLERELKRQTEGSAQLRALQTELDTAKQLYSTLLTRLQEVNVLASVDKKGDARQINEAAVPMLPVAPRKELIVLMAFVASLALGVALSIGIELMDSGFRSVHQLEQQTGVAALGMVPFQSTGRLRRNQKPWLNVVDKPNSAYSEALRTIRTGIALSSADHPQRTVVVTSSVPGEGKTTTALSLAAASAASGARTLIIDCDMRQPSLHKNLSVDNEVGLAEFLSGQRDLEDLVQVEPKTGLYYVLAGKRPPSPTDLLGSLRMRRLLQQLSDAFDLVVLDSPPVLAVSDALLLVRQTDTTIFVVRWEKTRRDVAMTGVKMVYEAGARLSGIVLSQVDLRRHAQYDYTDSGVYYYRGYRRYYGDG
ncbi:GumC family protein [Reyranella sp. CPCC 100927]|uniref:GumC family protein n=1 Tax=Reyranella sp. CPCC 100927 TaxID=2599616 RepID=UPI0011B4324F|nr:polysaccharide biosynthesis tyrosine autokinase [Reyranella sp. CPCC 100927]TWT14983.1 polysaccharide biosynthesis tyrosine autokinase [Reyranella sp. CPCC 100927]